jgi:hypothetical protein
MWTKGHGEVVAALLKAGCDTSLVVSIRDPQVRGLFVEHLEKKQRKMLALAGGRHRRLGTESVVCRVDKMVWEQAPIVR